MLLNFLGRGSAFNIKEGNNSAFIKINNELNLFDCGEGIFERIVKNKLLDNIRNVNVFITHMHSDHIGSLSSLIYYCYYIKNIVVNVYFPYKHLAEFLEMQGNIEGESYKFNLIQLEEDNLINSISIKTIEVKHAKTLKCFGYLIKLKDKLIWYSGDCAEISDVINKYEIDEFYQDTCLADYKGNAHTSLRVLAEYIQQEKRNKIYCMHIDCDELIEKAKELGFNVVKVKE